MLGQERLEPASSPDALLPLEMMDSPAADTLRVPDLVLLSLEAGLKMDFCSVQ